MPPQESHPSRRAVAVTQSGEHDTGLQLVLQRMDQIHSDLGDIKKVQTDIVTRLAVGAQTIEAVKDLPLEHALLAKEVETMREDVKDLMADRKAIIWKIITAVFVLLGVVGSLTAMILKAPAPHAP